MNAQQLRTNADKLQTNVSDKRKQAERLLENATQHENSGDESRAQIDRAEAEKLIAAADQEDREMAALVDSAAAQEALAVKIDQKQAELEAAHKREMDKLEAEKRALRGGPIGLFL